MNVIVNAFAFKEDCGNSMQLTGRNDDQKLQIYMKDLVVSLTSAKLHNPEDEVLLVTNRELPERYQNQLNERGIKTTILPYNQYVMPKDFAWSLAFYKLCVLEYLANETAYDACLLLDTDTVTMHSFTDLWKEASHGLMLYPVNHAYSHPDRDEIRQVYQQLYPNGTENIIHYGGEFICAKRKCLWEFMQKCKEVYGDITKNLEKMNKKIGDEVILSIAAANYRLNNQVIESGAYIFRFWTEINYLVATNTIHNPICIWHTPAEKDMGLVVLYDYYRKHLKYPNASQTARILGIVDAKRPLTVTGLRSRMKRKMVSLGMEK